MGGEENQSVGTPSSASKRKRKLGPDSEDDDDDDDDSDDPEDDDDEEEEEIKKVKKVETFDEVKTKPKVSKETRGDDYLQRSSVCSDPAGRNGPGHQHRGARQADRETSQGEPKRAKC